MVFIKFPFDSAFKYLDSQENLISSNVLYDTISSYLGTRDFLLCCGKQKLLNNETIPVTASVQCVFSLPGGKGGFGSMLRAIGAQIEKTTNREACRDLSGRRLRDINEEQRLKRWIAKDAERQAEKMKRRQERLERLKSKPKHNFADVEFERALSQMPERIDEALSVGLQKVKDPKKEESEVIKCPKEKRSWFDADLSSSTSDSGSEEEESPAAKRCKKESRPENDKINSDQKLSSFSSSDDSNERGLYSASVSDKMNSNDSHIEESSIGKYENKNAPSTSDFPSDREVQSDIKPDISAPCKEKQNAINCDISFPTEEQEDMKPVVLSPYKDDQNTTKHDMKPNISSTEELNNGKQNIESNTSHHTAAISKLNNIPLTEVKMDDSVIDLLKFQNVAELEALGLDKLKSALVARGLKCGGTLSDRAQRLWKIRNLQPDEYPPNLLAKAKK